MKSKNVLILLETSTGFDRSLLLGIAKFLRYHSSWSVFADPPYFRDIKSPGFFSKIEKLGLDGIILREPGVYMVPHAQIMRQFAAMGLPIIAVSSTVEKVEQITTIRTNNDAIGQLGAEHFFERGFQNFGFCGFTDLSWSDERGAGFAKRVIEKGHRVSFYSEKESKLWAWSDSVKKPMAEWIRSLPKPVGIMACNDHRGQQVIDACKVAGARVPDDVAILGVDNDLIYCDLSSPQLSSIALNAEKGGFEAAVLLDRLMKSGRAKRPDQIVVEPQYIVTRVSTDSIAVEDADVANTIRFIREHIRENLQINDILNALSISRSKLYEKFQKLVGCSLYDEIHRVKVEKIAGLLIESNNSISVIAMDYGYTDLKNFSRYFKQIKGLSPKEYRDKYSNKRQF